MNTESVEPRPQGRALSLRARFALGVLLLAVGAAALGLIFITEPVAEREAAVRQTSMLVDVTTVESGTFRPVIEAMGTVRPAREIKLTSRVSGEVTALSDSFVPGGFVRRGEVVVRLDDSDYRNLLQQRESELNQAIAQLEIEHGRQDLAERDYRELRNPVADDKRALILREPHLRSAEAVVQSARAALGQARLDLERTAIKAPFDAQVLSREVNLGSQVAPGDALARLAGVETYWIETTIPLDRLRWLSFAGNGEMEGSPVSIMHRTAWGPGQTRRGFLYRLIGELEGNTRLARVLVAVDDPLARNAESPDAPPLMIGTFVECRIEGREIPNVQRLRREYLRSNDTVWLVRDGVLAVQAVEIVLQDAEYAYIQGGLRAGDQVITSSLATVKEGTPLRLKTAIEQ